MKLIIEVLKSFEICLSYNHNRKKKRSTSLKVFPHQGLGSLAPVNVICVFVSTYLVIDSYVIEIQVSMLLVQ